MTGNGQAIQAFEKKGSGAGMKGFPFLVGAAGIGCAAVAVFTAAAPSSLGAAVQVSQALDKAGLDKGPLLLFGVALCALAATMRRGDRALAASGASEEASLVGQQILGDMGSQTTLLSGLQAEVNAARSEIAEARQEIKTAAEASEQDTNSEASDPMFRMAASLDQLGARIGKRLDGSRDEMLEAVGAMRSFVEDVSERSRAEREAFALEQRKLVESLREAQSSAAAPDQSGVEEQIAQLRADITALVDGLASLAPRVAEAPAPAAEVAAEPAEPVEAAHQEPLPEEPAPEAHSDPEVVEANAVDSKEFCEDYNERQPIAAPALPMELSDEQAPVLRMAPLEAAPAAPSEAAEVTVEADQVAQPEAPLPAAEPVMETPPLPFGQELTSVPANGLENEAPVPPAPLPAPGEGLELIDDMNADRARAADLTPPLFPEIDPGAMGG